MSRPGGLSAAQGMTNRDVGALAAAHVKEEGEYDEVLTALEASAHDASKPTKNDDAARFDPRAIVSRVRRAMADCSTAAERLGANVLAATFGEAKNDFHREVRTDKRHCRDLDHGFRYSEACTLDAWLRHLRAAQARRGAPPFPDNDSSGGPPLDGGRRRGRGPSAAALDDPLGHDRWSLDEALRLRKNCLAVVFLDLRDRHLSAGRDEDRRRERREDRFRDLLRDYVYRREHLDDDWADLEPDLARHSAFDAVHPDRRRALFDDHKVALKQRLADAPPPRPAPAAPGAVREEERWNPANFHGPEPPPKKAPRLA